LITAIREISFLPRGGLWEADDREAVSRVMEEGGFFPLPEEQLFQEAFARHEGAAAAVAVNSCGTALDLCMMALGVGPGDEVIVPPLTFLCTATCAAARGARVVFADIDAETLCLSAEAVRRKITPRTRAVIPVHFAGRACDVEAFDALTRETGIPVIYDAAHAAGALWNGRPVGAAGKASCYSFQANKNMTTLGEGGAVTTNDLEFGETVRRKKTFGFVYGAAPRAVTLGFNYRMTKPQLACGLTQLAKLDRAIALRLERFRRLQELLAGVDELILPGAIEAGHASHLYTVRLACADRDEFRACLRQRFGIHTVVHYPAVYSWEVFRNLDHDASGCPVAEEACRQIFSLPVFPLTPFEDLEYLRDGLKEALAGRRSRP
jgi:perosamine synthetase